MTQYKTSLLFLMRLLQCCRPAQSMYIDIITHPTNFQGFHLPYFVIVDEQYLIANIDILSATNLHAALRETSRTALQERDPIKGIDFYVCLHASLD